MKVHGPIEAAVTDEDGDEVDSLTVDESSRTH